VAVHEDGQTMVLHCSDLAVGQRRREAFTLLTMPPAPTLGLTPTARSVEPAANKKGGRKASW
jgi:hypothetical protein